MKKKKMWPGPDFVLEESNVTAMEISSTPASMEISSGFNFGGNHTDSEIEVCAHSSFSRKAKIPLLWHESFPFFFLLSPFFFSSRFSFFLCQLKTQAEVERTWGVYLKKVKLVASAGYQGSLAGFSLSDVSQVLGSYVPRTLGDDEQCEELCFFALRDGRVAAVWCGHCLPECCSACVYGLAGWVGFSAEDVKLALPEKLRRFVTD